MRILVVCFFLLAGPLYASFAQSSAGSSGAVPAQQVRLAMQRLQAWYNPETGLWNSTGWWNSANALTSLIDDARASGDAQFRPVIARTYALNVHSGFLNDYYDDEGWWALAWIDAYDLTGDQRYLTTAGSIFADMTDGWDQTCGGGIWWSKKRTYKNAIANELFLSVAAHLANRAESPAERASYDGWARREWKWFRHSGMIERDHLISDGLTAGCKDNHRTKWSYNQGVVLGGLAELSREGHGGSLREANAIAKAAIRHLSDGNGIMHDPCEPNCGADGTQFKGIFVRNLAVLNQLKPTKLYQSFIVANAESILKNDQNADHGSGVVWSGPPGAANASTQSSAMDALIAALQIETEELPSGAKAP